MEKYSVLMSLYIKEKPEFLKISIDSMLHQTILPNEIVIVTDGFISSELKTVLDFYETAYIGLFRIIGYETNKGLGYALNYGMIHCNNDLIARMDTDDISIPERCELQLRCFEEMPELSIVGGYIQEFIDFENNAVGRRVVPPKDSEIKQYIKNRCPMNHMTVMFRKKEVMRCGGYQPWHYNEDYYLWIRMVQGECQFMNLSNVLVKVRVGNEMYKRRGGVEYFRSEKALQRYMLKNNMIGCWRYWHNVIIRFYVQIMLPSSIRSVVFQKLTRLK